MSVIRYQMEDRKKEHIDVNLLSVSSSRYEGDWPSIPHTHYFTEIFYVKSGTGEFLIEGNHFPIQKNDLIIVNPMVEHTEVSFDSSPLDYIILGVEGPTFSFPDQKEYGIFHCSDKKDDLMFFFSALLQEIEEKKKNYNLICQDLTEVLLLRLSRQANSPFEIVSSQKGNRECARIKRYIDTNFKDDITLDSLAKMAHLNKYYFVHAFSRAYGLSPMNYLVEKRIQSCKELLQSTDHRIAEIARIAGFSSQSYFSQIFRKKCGMTPKDYRKFTRKN